MFRRIERLRADDPTVVHECRRCGTTVETTDDPCPYCGPTDVVRYEF